MNSAIGTTFNRILLTGAAGGLGQALRSRLSKNCEVLRLSDIQSVGDLQSNEEFVKADLSDFEQISSAVVGCDAIVHLGGISVEAPFKSIMQANILGVYHLYEAAVKHGVKRIVFASSNHVVGYYSQGETIDADDAPRPDGYYGLSKVYGESLSRMYFDRYGIETACVRIGSSYPKPKDRRMLATWLSYDDLHRLVTACLETPILNHTIVFGMSDNAVTWWDNRCAKHIGYRPQDSSDSFRHEVFTTTSSPDVTDAAARHQGGNFVKAKLPRERQGN